MLVTILVTEIISDDSDDFGDSDNYDDNDHFGEIFVLDNN